MLSIEIKHLIGYEHGFAIHSVPEELQVAGPREWKEVMEEQLKITK